MSWGVRLIELPATTTTTTTKWIGVMGWWWGGGGWRQGRMTSRDKSKKAKVQTLNFFSRFFVFCCSRSHVFQNDEPAVVADACDHATVLARSNIPDHPGVLAHNPESRPRPQIPHAHGPVGATRHKLGARRRRAVEGDTFFIIILNKISTAGKCRARWVSYVRV
jgi:hypothetical protein